MRKLWCVFYCCFVSSVFANGVQLANVYQNEHVTDYLVSEKYDGIRAIWDGKKLTTRNGHPIYPPVWFTEGWPNQWFDGELWAGRQQFNVVQNTVLSTEPDDSKWSKITYMVFDAPNKRDPFAIRAIHYTSLIGSSNSKTIQPITQITLSDEETLFKYLDSVTATGGEGLMLHRKDAMHRDGRTSALLKLKRFQDGEAKVLQHLPGKGKYQGMMGALLVETVEGTRFRLGTGFSDSERRNPPTIGQYVTFRYQGLTKGGLPRFASFIRIRADDFELREIAP